jgi:hypothetical protein
MNSLFIYDLLHMKWNHNTPPLTRTINTKKYSKRHYFYWRIKNVATYLPLSQKIQQLAASTTTVLNFLRKQLYNYYVAFSGPSGLSNNINFGSNVRVPIIAVNIANEVSIPK